MDGSHLALVNWLGELAIYNASPTSPSPSPAEWRLHSLKRTPTASPVQLVSALLAFCSAPHMAHMLVLGSHDTTAASAHACAVTLVERRAESAAMAAAAASG